MTVNRIVQQKGPNYFLQCQIWVEPGYQTHHEQRWKWARMARQRVLDHVISECTENPYFGGSRSFKVISVGTTGKLVSRACYDKQQGVYLQLFSC